jgi:(R,R)-butanediol dehydrogenase/meso-butanediol dehydrogenase/diacetyl reductase
MRVVVLQGPSNVQLVEIDEPELLPGSVIVEIDWCGVSGSDLDAFLLGTVPAPAWFGHEWSGRVVQIGPGVLDHFIGERVIGAAPPPCGKCRTCVAGLGQYCDLVVDMIVGADELASNHGSFAERIRVDARRLHRVPEAVDGTDAALAEPAAVAAHAITRAAVQLGDLVAVVGVGSIGLLSAELARLSGAGAVVVVDENQSRRELACDLGADAAFGPGPDAARWLADRSHGLGADVVLDCAGSADSLATSTLLVRRGGTVVAVGVRAVGDDLVATGLVERQIDLRASLGYGLVDTRRIFDLLADDRLRVGPLRETEPIGLGELGTFLTGYANGKPVVRKPIVAPAL